MGRPKKIKSPTDVIFNSPSYLNVPIHEVEAVMPATVTMTVTFTGDPRGGKDPEVAGYGGASFPKGKPVEVDAEWLKINANIRKNNHFKVE